MKKKEIVNKSYTIKNNLAVSSLLIFVLFLTIMGIMALIVIFMPQLFKESGSTEFNSSFFWFILIGTILVMTLPFYLGVIMMRIKAVPQQKFKDKNTTIKEILTKNSTKFPFEIVQDKKYDLLLKFKLADAKWRGTLFKGGLDKAYWLYLKLDETKKIVYCCEKTRTIKWDLSAGPHPNAEIRLGIFYGIILLDIEKIKMYDPFQKFKQVTDVSYNISEFKWPIFKILIKNGWTIKPRLFPFQVKHS